VARIKSAVKNKRKSIRRNAINRRRRSGLRTQVKKLREMIDGKDAAAARAALGHTAAGIARAHRRGTIHRNAAARLTSRLTRRVNALEGGR
jgi:small subunit ribosomal protein S20